MNKSVCGMILGESGSGKSSGIRNLDPKATIVFSCLGKGLPVKNSGKNYPVWNKETCPDGNLIITSSAKSIIQWLKYISEKMPHITTIVIDDSTFLSAKELDRRRDENGYQKFNDIAHDFLQITEIANTLREGLHVFFLYHSVTTGDGIIEPQFTRALSHGKMIQEKLASIEAQFELVLLACKIVDKDNNLSYKFKTRDINSTAKSPMGMFDEEYIDNDLAQINERIRCYYNGDCDEDRKEVKIKK